MPQTDETPTASDAADPFEGIRIYRDFEIDASLREDPITFYKRQHFLQMYAADQQSRDTRLTLAATVAVTVVPALVGTTLPPLDAATFHQFLSTVFQGFCGLLGLLAVALVYYLQQLEEGSRAANAEFKQYLHGVGCPVSASRPLEMWRHAEDKLDKVTKKKRQDEHHEFSNYIQVRANHCTKLEFAAPTLRAKTFALLPPTLLLLSYSLAGLAAGSLGSRVQNYLAWPILCASILLAAAVIVRCMRLAREYFWVSLRKARGPAGMEELPPDSFPGRPR